MKHEHDDQVAGNDIQMCARTIATVRCTVPDEAIARSRRTLLSELHVLPEFETALTGIEAYSHLLVLFWMHRRGAAPDLLSHPRGDPSAPLTGALAGRGRNHPNPIGLAVVELVERQGCVLVVRRLDAYDGTPVIDIKPYDDYDRVASPRVPEWFKKRAGSND